MFRFPPKLNLAEYGKLNSHSGEIGNTMFLALGLRDNINRSLTFLLIYFYRLSKQVQDQISQTGERVLSEGGWSTLSLIQYFICKSVVKCAVTINIYIVPLHLIGLVYV